MGCSEKKKRQGLSFLYASLSADLLFVAFILARCMQLSPPTYPVLNSCLSFAAYPHYGCLELIGSVSVGCPGFLCTGPLVCFVPLLYAFAKNCI